MLIQKTWGGGTQKTAFLICSHGVVGFERRWSETEAPSIGFSLESPGEFSDLNVLVLPQSTLGLGPKTAVIFKAPPVTAHADEVRKHRPGE